MTGNSPDVRRPARTLLPSGDSPPEGVLAAFSASFEALADVPLGEVDQPWLEAEVALLTAAKRRIDARLARAIHELHDRVISTAEADHPDDDHAANRAARALGQDLREQRLHPPPL